MLQKLRDEYENELNFKLFLVSLCATVGTYCLVFYLDPVLPNIPQYSGYATVFLYGALNIIAAFLVSICGNIMSVFQGYTKSYVYKLLSCIRASAFFACIVYCTLCVFESSDFTPNYLDWISVFLTNAILLLIFFPELPLFIKEKKEFKKSKKFAYGAVGIQNDQYGFSDRAAREVRRVMPIKGESLNDDSVEVWELDGPQGNGKSSFQRMMIEHLEKSQPLLYTYLSLTETSEGEDFNLVFKKRWQDTLCERYPHLFVVRDSALSQIIRSNNTFFQSILNLVPHLFESLVLFLASSDKRYDANLANTFLYKTDFNEKIWIFVFDEVDRAYMEEIYQMLEIIERIKNITSKKLPIKIIFLIVVDESVLNARIETQIKIGNDKASIVSNFFDDLKSFQRKIGLPNINLLHVRKYIKKQILDALSFELTNHSDWVNNAKADLEKVTFFERVIYFDNRRKYSEDDKLSYVIDLIAKSRKRFIQRLLSSFQDRLNYENQFAQRIRSTLADALLFEYGSLRYNWFSSFLEKIAETKGGPNWQFEAGLSSNDRNSENVDVKIKNLLVKNGVFANVEDVSKEEVELIFLVAPFISDYFKGADKYSVDDYYSFAYAPNLKHYIQLDMVQSTNELALFDYFEKYTQDKGVIRQMDANTFASFVEWISFLDRSVEKEEYLPLFDEILERIQDKEYIIDKENYENSTREKLLTALVRIISIVAQQRPDESNERVFEAFLTLIEPGVLTVGEACRLISSLLSRNRQVDSYNLFIKNIVSIDTQKRKEKLFQHLQSFFEYARSIYLEQDIYEKEPHSMVSYAVYQGWAVGLPDSDEISRMQNIAQRELLKHPEVIEYFWRPLLYVFDKTQKKPEKLLQDLGWEATGLPIHSPHLSLRDLIRVTIKIMHLSDKIMEALPFYEAILEDPRYKTFESQRQQTEKPSDNNSPDMPLVSHLALLGYIQPQIVNLRIK